SPEDYAQFLHQTARPAMSHSSGSPWEPSPQKGKISDSHEAGAGTSGRAAQRDLKGHLETLGDGAIALPRTPVLEGDPADPRSPRAKRPLRLPPSAHAGRAALEPARFDRHLRLIQRDEGPANPRRRVLWQAEGDGIADPYGDGPPVLICRDRDHRQPSA